MRLTFLLYGCFSLLSCSLKADNKISSSKIQSSIQKGEEMNYEDMAITDDLHLIDLDAAVKTSPTVFDVSIKPALVFKNCTFSGMIIGSLKDNNKNTYSTTFLRSIYFENCTFDDDVNLEGATINGFCNFLNCTFKKGALFNRITFNSTVAITKCSFNQSAGFQYCTFMNNAFYNEDHFSDACFFQNSYFYREFTFNLVKCDGYADFSSANFYSNIYCNYAQFKKNFVASAGNFRGRTEFVSTKFFNAEFDGSIFSGPSIFEKAEFSEGFSLKDCKFLVAKPRTAGYKAGKIDVSGAEYGGLNKLSEF
jgi:hypothetical protein